MTITAKYPGRCSKCGQAIRPGQQIEWNKNTRETFHVTCPGKAAPSAALAPYRLSGGSGYGCNGWRQGDVVRASQRQREELGYPEWLYVVRATQRYVRDDGMSFGVGDESGYVYSADCREATPEEAAPHIARLEQAQKAKAAKARVAEIAKRIQDTGERPEGDNRPAGERMFDTQNIYGGGDWFVVGPEWIWYVQNNGADGDNWSLNNVVTGGAGAIGWRIPFDQALAHELRTLAVTLGGSAHK
jgi:hypothetical protein